MLFSDVVRFMAVRFRAASRAKFGGDLLVIVTGNRGLASAENLPKIS